jgi:hypothetical protein
VYGQGKEIEKSYHWSYQVNTDVSFDFNNYDCDLIIHTWDKPEIAYTMSVDATLKTEDDARRLDGYIENLEFSHSVGHVKFDNRFWTSKKAVMGKKTIGLKGEKTIRFSEFKMQGEMWIPENCVLNLSSKYSEIEVDDLQGRVSLDLYNDKVYGKAVKDHMKLAAKYSTLEFTEMKDIKADLYNTTVETGNIGNLQVVSKYSKFEAGDAGKVDIDAYSDKYTLGKVGDIRFIDKYSDLIAEQGGHTEMDCYNSTVSIRQVEDVELKSKYGSYEFEEARNLSISSAYNDKYEIESLRSLNVTDSKYGVYRIDYLDNSLLLDEGYSDKLYIKGSGGLKGLKVNGKYVVLELGIDEKTDFRFKADVKYPKFDINEEAMNIKIKIKEGSDLKMEAIKGTETEGMPSFYVNGYDMAVTLTEQ